MLPWACWVHFAVFVRLFKGQWKGEKDMPIPKGIRMSVYVKK